MELNPNSHIEEVAHFLKAYIFRHDSLSIFSIVSQKGRVELCRNVYQGGKHPIFSVIWIATQFLKS